MTELFYHYYTSMPGPYTVIQFTAGILPFLDFSNMFVTSFCHCLVLIIPYILHYSRVAASCLRIPDTAFPWASLLWLGPLHVSVTRPEPKTWVLTVFIHNSGFVDLDTTDSWPGLLRGAVRRAVGWSVSCTSRLYSPGASTSPSPSCHRQKCLQTLPNVPTAIARGI